MQPEAQARYSFTLHPSGIMNVDIPTVIAPELQDHGFGRNYVANHLLYSDIRSSFNRSDADQGIQYTWQGIAEKDPAINDAP